MWVKNVFVNINIKTLLIHTSWFIANSYIQTHLIIIGHMLLYLMGLFVANLSKIKHVLEKLCYY
jgi:hypothetical protein